MFCDKSFWRSKAGLALAGALLLGGVYLVTEHAAHLWAALPFAFVLACPLMHLFMHHGHGGHATSPAPVQAVPKATAVSEADPDT